MAIVAASLIEICQQARNLFLQEPRLIRLKTPTYILGDLHGNFSDLICFEKVIIVCRNIDNTADPDWYKCDLSLLHIKCFSSFSGCFSNETLTDAGIARMTGGLEEGFELR